MSEIAESVLKVLPDPTDPPPGVLYSLSCGCVNYVDQAFRIKRCHSKCSFHREELRKQPTGYAYYKGLGILQDGQYSPEKYLQELHDGIGELPDPGPGVHKALEIGCGVSPYVGIIQDANYAYEACEPDPWAAGWMSGTFNVPVLWECFPSPNLVGDRYRLVLAAHSLEHMPDAPNALKAMYYCLQRGGHLIVIVPNDRDETNPDHWWFFTPDTLKNTLELVGFEVLSLKLQKIIAREDFLYCLARKI